MHRKRAAAGRKGGRARRRAVDRVAKKASGVPTDLDENSVREIGLAAGLVDNKVCAIDETWSGLRFVIRLADR
jgi:hypothetical protein